MASHSCSPECDDALNALPFDLERVGESKVSKYLCRFVRRVGAEERRIDDIPPRMRTGLCPLPEKGSGAIRRIRLSFILYLTVPHITIAEYPHPSLRLHPPFSMDDPPESRRGAAKKAPVSESRRRDKPQLSCTMCRRRK
jgi:hypothetical protein